MSKFNAAPDEREVWALARAVVNAPEPAPGEVDPAAEYVRLARAALAARPAPVVSGEAVIEYVARVINDPRYGHDAEWLRLNLRASHLRQIAALGITAADAPAADDEGGQER